MENGRRAKAPYKDIAKLSQELGGMFSRRDTLNPLARSPSRNRTFTLCTGSMRGGRAAGQKLETRVPYVFIKNEKAKLQIEQAEDPDYVEENGVSLDTLYYFTP
jgi:hypothetical protein